jgi:hypothetical protein
MEVVKMTKVIIEKVNGEEQAIATLQLNLGKVYREREVELEDGTTANTVVTGVGIDNTERYFRELLKLGTSEEYLEQFDARLDEYVKLRINQLIGVKQFPLQFDKDGNIVGLSEDVEVEIHK